MGRGLSSVCPPQAVANASRRESFILFFEHIVHHIFGRRNTIRSKVKAVHCWNSGGFSLEHEPHKDSIRKGRVKQLLRDMYSAGFLLWQETGMSDGLASIIQQVDPNVSIAHTPPNEQFPYGAAILWPRHKYGDQLWTRELIPGCAVAAGVHTADGPVTLISVYAPNNKQAAVLQVLRKYFEKGNLDPVVIVGGDFNFRNGGSAYQDAVHFLMTTHGMKPDVYGGSTTKPTKPEA